jgi:uncharacterized protein with GYD domain
MSTYFMFGEYSPIVVSEISSERTAEAEGIIEECGGKLKSGYVLLGEKDLVLIADFPGTKAVIKASLMLSDALGIAFASSPALSIAEFDKLVEGD